MLLLWDFQGLSLEILKRRSGNVQNAQLHIDGIFSICFIYSTSYFIHTIELSYLCTFYTVYTFRYLKSNKHFGTFRLCILYWATHGCAKLNSVWSSIRYRTNLCRWINSNHLCAFVQAQTQQIHEMQQRQSAYMDMFRMIEKRGKYVNRNLHCKD